MFLPFKIPHAGLQAMRKKMFYWRVVNWYRFAMQNEYFENKWLHKVMRFTLILSVVKMLQKGANARQTERLHDYNLRKDNVRAVEATMWDDELSVHSVDVGEAEKSVLRMRTWDWEMRQKPEKWADKYAKEVLLPVDIKVKYA